MEMDRRKGERRKEFCAFHEVHRREIKEASEGTKTKTPIWVFLFFATAMLSTIGWLNYDVTKKSASTQRSLTLHIEASNRLQQRVIHGLNTVAWNQRRVMSKIELPFEDVPGIEVE